MLAMTDLLPDRMAERAPQTVLVTGAGGFVGRAVCARLQQAGLAVRVAVRDPRQSMGFHIALQGELGPDTDWSAALSGCSAVVHLANIAHTRAEASRLERVNVQATARLAAEAARAGVRRFVYLSSIKARMLDDEDDAYGRSKRAAEEALSSVVGLQSVSLRPPLVYGPGVKANFLALMRAIDRGWPLPLAGIDNRRSLVFVGNLADAVCAVLLSERLVPGTYEVCDAEAFSTPQLCRAIGAALGRPARLFGLPLALLEWLPPMRKLTRSLLAEDAGFRAAYGWVPPHDALAGLAETAAWYRERADARR